MIAIIGINSFSGTMFARNLLQLDIPVLGFARSNSQPGPFTPHLNLERRQLAMFKVWRTNLLEDYQFIADEISRNKVNYIINFAAQSMVGESWNHPEDWYETNVSAFSKLISSISRVKNCQLKKFVQFTTPEVYGSTSGLVTENWNFNPRTPYAISRAASDLHLRALFDQFDFPVIFTRASNVYGPHQKLYRLIPKLIMKILKNEKFDLHGNGNSRRSFIYSDDVTTALMAIIESGRIGDTYHISTREIVSIKDLVERILLKLGKNFEESINIVNERPGKDDAYLLDSLKLRSELNWSDKITLNQGIDNVISWIIRDFEELKFMPLEYIHSR